MIQQRVAVIIPFVAWNSFVRETVEGCLALHYTNYRIVLMPDEDFCLPALLLHKHLRVIPTGPQTIAEKRNIGIREETADVYAFIDSDAFPRFDWLCNGLIVLQNNPAIGAVGGPNLCPPQDSYMRRMDGNALKSYLVSGSGAFRKSDKANRYCIDLPTCNLLVRQATLSRTGLFNPHLKTGEDMDLCCRIISSGQHIYFCRDVLVYHHNRPLFAPFFLQRFTYGSTVFTLLKSQFTFLNLMLTAPLFFILSLLSCGLAGLWFPQAWTICALVLVLYGLLLIVETVRHSNGLKEMPLTFIALLIGNLGPGIGSLATLSGFRINLKQIYQNDYT